MWLHSCLSYDWGVVAINVTSGLQLRCVPSLSRKVVVLPVAHGWRQLFVSFFIRCFFAKKTFVISVWLHSGYSRCNQCVVIFLCIFWLKLVLDASFLVHFYQVHSLWFLPDAFGVKRKRCNVCRMCLKINLLFVPGASEEIVYFGCILGDKFF